MTITQLPPAKPLPWAAAPGQRGIRTRLRIGLTLIAVAAAAIWIPRALPSLDTLRSTFHTVSWTWVFAAALLQFGSIGMLIRQQRRLLRALGTPIPLRRMAAITYSSTALAISLPAGAAVSAGYSFRQFRTNGASPRAAGLALVLSGALSISSLVLLFGIGWAVVAASGPDGGIATHRIAGAVLVLTAVTLATIFAIAGARRARRRRTGRLTAKTRHLDQFEQQHRTIGGAIRKLRDLLRDTRTVRPGDWHLVLLFTHAAPAAPAADA